MSLLYPIVNPTRRSEEYRAVLQWRNNVAGNLSYVEGRVTTNETNIATNVANIATNATNIATNATNIEQHLWSQHPNNVAWDDLRFPATSVRTGATAGAVPSWANFRNGLYTYSFSHLSDNEIFFNAQLPHGYKEGTDLEFHVHWSQADADSGSGVRWCLEYIWANMGAAFVASAVIEATGTTTGTQYDHIYTNISSLSGTGKKISSMLMCRLYRDVSNVEDDYAAGAFLLECDFHYQADSVGSQNEGSK